MTSLERLTEAMIALDRALTGNEGPRAAQMARNQRRLLENPFDLDSARGGYALSDGGYSRVVWNELDGLELSQVSRPAVKQRWRQAAAAIDAANGAIDARVDELCARDGAAAPDPQRPEG